MVWAVSEQIASGKRTRLWGGAFLCCLCLMLVTPRIPHSPNRHIFADMRNFLGVPNTLNVMTNFPFLVVGVLGFVFCLQGNFFDISLRGEVWGWALFYAGTAGVAFGSAYYHLKPDNNRVMWDTLPMMIAYSSLYSSFMVERVGERIGLSCLLVLLLVSFLSTSYERKYDDLRLCMAFQLIPSIVIPGTMCLFQPKYTHSRYWIFAAGAHILAKLEGVADRKIYRANHYFISGHSLEHLCLAMVPLLLSIMLTFRRMKFQRQLQRVYMKRVGAASEGICGALEFLTRIWLLEGLGDTQAVKGDGTSNSCTKFYPDLPIIMKSNSPGIQGNDGTRPLAV